MVSFSKYSEVFRDVMSIGLGIVGMYCAYQAVSMIANDNGHNRSTCWCGRCILTIQCDRDGVFICKKQRTSLYIDFNSSNHYYEYSSYLRKVRYCGCCHTYGDVINHRLTGLLSKDVSTSRSRSNRIGDVYPNKLMIIVGDESLVEIPRTSKVLQFEIHNCPSLTTISNRYTSDTQWLKNKSLNQEQYVTDHEEDIINALHKNKLRKLVKIQRYWKWNNHIKKILETKLQESKNDKMLVNYIGTFYL
jgi:hypothetical protein